MEILFLDTKTKKTLEDSKKLIKKYGKEQAIKVITRINELKSAENLHDISRLPQARLHLLSGDLKGSFAVNVKQPYRLILWPLDGQLDNLKTITRIRIDRITDYH